MSGRKNQGNCGESGGRVRAGNAGDAWIAPRFASIGAAICLAALALGKVQAAETPLNLGTYENIVSRDPFDPERGRSEADDEETTQAAETDFTERYELYGIIASGDMRQAFMKVVDEPRSGRRPGGRSAPGAELRTVTEGDIVDGWRVARITQDGIELESAGEVVRLGVFDSPKDERRATAPVALQTPQPRAEVPPPPPPVVTAPQAVPTQPEAHVSEVMPQPDTAVPSHATGTTPRPQIFGGGISKPGPRQGDQPAAGSVPTRPPVFTPPSPSGAGGTATNPFLELLKRSQTQNQ